MYAKKNSVKKILAMALAVVLLIGVSVGGTIAWLMDTSNSVTNTFTVGDIAIELKEHKLDNNGQLTSGTANEVEANVEDSYKILPGTKQPKDPFVRFTEDSEACWLFVKIEEKNNAVAGKSYKYVTYTVDDAWEPLNDANNDNIADDGIYYIDLTSGAVSDDTTKNILKNTEVTYNSDLTKEELAVAKNAAPQLIFTAYAVQKEAGTAAQAWNLVKDNPVG